MVFGGRSSQDGAASEELDASVVDVKINDEELEQFDEEFSDIGDFDDTMTSELPENLLQNEPPEGAAFVTGDAGSILGSMHTGGTGLRDSGIFATNNTSPDAGIANNVYDTLPMDDDPDFEVEVSCILGKFVDLYIGYLTVYDRFIAVAL